MDDEKTAPSRPWGLPWWAAILLPLVTTAAGAYVDSTFDHGLGVPFRAAYAGGCVLAVLLVRRRNLFGPMVQPPLILLFAASPVVLLTSGHGLSGSLSSQALTVGAPLVDNFMVQVGVTIATVVLGVIRLILTRRPPPPPTADPAPTADATPA
jgi:hypothetical protein